MTIHELFRSRAAQTPTALAMVHGERRVDFQTLDAASDVVAAVLAGAGVGPGGYVPVRLPRSAELAATLIGILKLGACYAALDTAWPQPRVAALGARLGGPLVVAQDGAAPPGIPVLRLPGGDVAAWAKEQVSPPRCRVRDTDPAAVFFTSGSTGEPKGAVSPHRATVSLLARCRFINLDEGTVMPLAAPVPWDAFSLELWGTLLAGGTSVVVDEPYLDAGTLRRLAARHGVNTAWLGTALFNLIVEEDLAAFAGLHQVMIGGEWASPEHVREFLRRYPDVRLVNGYGPVECTVFAATHPIRLSDCDQPDGIPLGRPVAETEIFVLAADGRVCGPGEQGEICLGGPRLATGYLAGAGDDGERFVSCPVAGSTRRLYRTGDLGHWSAERLLHYDGRMDRQVKIRGHRVAPEEIERELARLPGVTRCAVVPVADRSGRPAGLTAYYTTDGAPPDESDLRAGLSSQLPGYLVPGQFVYRLALPMLPSGKLDRRALEAEASSRPGAHSPGSVRPAPGPVLDLVRALYAAVLGLPEVPLDVPFFELGGSSLDAGRVCSRLSQRLGAPVPVSQLMRHPSARDLAAWAGTATSAPAGPASQAGYPPGPVPLLPIQVGFLLASELSADAASNCPFAWWVDGPLDVAALALATRDVQIRHEALRARYLLHDPPVAMVEPVPGPDPVQRVCTVDQEADALRLAEAELMRPLDIAAGEVWRVCLVRCTSTGRALLGVVVHHIAWDGHAELVAVDDLATCYLARVAGKEPVFDRPAPSLAGMSEQYHQLLSCAPLDEQRDYWRTELAGLAPVCFGDQPDPEAAAAGALDAWITPEDVETCDAVARTAGATRFAALINAFAEGVATVTGARDFGIGIPATKRGSQQLSHGVNCLIDIICLRARPDPYAEPAAALRAAGERMRAALTGQDISFGEVVRLVSPPRGDRPPLYQLMFTLEPKNDPGLQLAGCAVEFIRLDPPVAMTELGCALWPLPDGGYRAHLVYRPDRITRATVAAIGDAMLAAIRRAPRGAAPPLLTGWQGPASYFRFLECTSFDPAEAERVLRGERAGVVFRSAYPAQAVARALELFASHPAAARRDDDASGCYLGAYHYHKPTEQYLAQAAALRSALEEALWFDSSPWRSFREHLQAYFAGRGVEMRCAEQNGRRACLGVIRSWDRQGDFALVPHEDAAQCRHPAQAGFEIQRVLRHQVCAANLCLGNEGGGELIYWNLKPDDQARRAHRTYLTGGPYPASALRPAASIRLDVRPGDLYLFNGGHVHAVNRSRGLRATASTLLGFCDEHTLITWT